MLDSLSIPMQKYLYADLYKLEEIHWWHKAKRDLVGFFLKQTARKGSKILDVGCGTGKNVEEFANFGSSHGIDTSNEAIIFCAKRGLKNIIKGSIEKMPFPKQSFNIITALDVLEHVDDSKSLKEISRVLKDRGTLIATVPAFPILWSKWDEVLHHKRRYTKNTLKEVVEKNGFNITKISYVYSFLFLPAFIIRNVKKLLYKNYYPSDFKLSNKIINYLFEKIAQMEIFFIKRLNIPIGTSLIVVATKTKP